MDVCFGPISDIGPKAETERGLFYWPSICVHWIDLYGAVDLKPKCAPGIVRSSLVSRHHTQQGPEDLSSPASLETAVYVILTVGCAGATGSLVPPWVVNEGCNLQSGFFVANLTLNGWIFLFSDHHPVHVITHYKSLKASEALFLAKRCSM